MSHHPESIIHPSAQVSKESKIAKGVNVGPFCVIGPHVSIGENTVLKSHICIEGHTDIGSDNYFYSFVVVGSEPQDLSYHQEATKVIIGNKNTFREFISINRGTLKQDGVTKIGNEGFFMAYSHMGHDVTIGDKVRIVNSCNLAGHVTIGDSVILSGATNVGQFITIGKAAFLGGGSAVDRDIPCFSTAFGNRVMLKGINIVGLKRMGYDKQHISELVEFYRMMEISSMSAKSYAEQALDLDEYKYNPLVKDFASFIKNSKAGIPSFMP
ncbi:MAG: acyl-ACP--UDP-N-acetylglucosamine O-acyltransferase [Bacteriovoracaceae bacterium]|nr:acyl-ACP--UDP-N-acetylglucosamine O-acyltransferase [Bacteriovoracaceae bacterium]